MLAPDDDHRSRRTSPDFYPFPRMRQSESRLRDLSPRTLGSWGRTEVCCRPPTALVVVRSSSGGRRGSGVRTAHTDEVSRRGGRHRRRLPQPPEEKLSARLASVVQLVRRDTEVAIALRFCEHCMSSTRVAGRSLATAVVYRSAHLRLSVRRRRAFGSPPFVGEQVRALDLCGPCWCLSYVKRSSVVAVFERAIPLPRRGPVRCCRGASRCVWRGGV